MMKGIGKMKIVEFTSEFIKWNIKFHWKMKQIGEVFLSTVTDGEKKIIVETISGYDNHIQKVKKNLETNFETYKCLNELKG